MNDKSIPEALDALEKKIDRKPTMWDFLFILLVTCKVLDIGSPESLAALTWWHVFLIPYGTAIVLGIIGWAIVHFQVAKRLGISLYRVISWVKRRGAKRAA